LVDTLNDLPKGQAFLVVKVGLYYKLNEHHVVELKVLMINGKFAYNYNSIY